MARHRPRRIPRGMENIGLNGLRDAFARPGCVEETHVAGGAVLFDDTDDEQPVVTGYVHGEYVPAICETCRDFPEHLGITYVTRGGWPKYETYLDFGLDDVLDALERSR